MSDSNNQNASPTESWSDFVSRGPLAILTDLDGTLVPFAAVPELARPGTELVALLDGLAALPGVRVAIVSGRPRTWLDTFFGSASSLLLCAEHGGWIRDEGGWRQALAEDPGPLADLLPELERLALRHAGALLERKTWSVTLHFRAVAAHARSVLLVEASAAVDGWLARHPRFERLEGAEALEIRPVALRKSIAVPWVCGRAAPGARLLALGDDTTDEDMFAALGPGDRAILVGSERGRATHAGWRLQGSAAALALLRGIAAARSGSSGLAPGLWPEPIAAPATYSLLVVSNRLPELRSSASSPGERKRNVGGLVSALEPVLAFRSGLWLGWSGRTLSEAERTAPGLDDQHRPALAWVDFSEHWQRSYYRGLCNGALWPLLHSFPSHVRIHHADWAAYREVNAAFGAAAMRLVGPESTVWIHDYHLMLLGRLLRAAGHRGPLGFFLHVPFPGPDVFAVLPWAEEILDALLDLDLVGFHTQSYADNFIHCAASMLGAIADGGVVRSRGRVTRVGAFPLGILPEGFQEEVEPAVVAEVQALARAIAPTRLVLGVDRLDYTKGIPERIEAFGRMLELFPEWRRKVSLVQVSVPSRADIPEYAEQRARIENVVGRINGELGDADWVPIRYLYRSYGRAQLSELYRAAHIGYVTPLRDGMNLVAKEYVAAQDPADPGVLVLSRFAGAAAELTDAVLTNPWDVEGMARDLDRALRLELPERRARHARLLATVSRTTALTWAAGFLSALEAGSVSDLTDLRVR